MFGQNYDQGQGGHELHSYSLLAVGGAVTVLADNFLDEILTEDPAWTLGTGVFGNDIWASFDDANAPDGDAHTAGLSPGIDRPNDSWMQADFAPVDPTQRVVSAEVHLSVDNPQGNEDNAVDIILMGEGPVAWARLRPGGTATLGVGGTLMDPAGQLGGIDLDPADANVPIAHVTSATNVIVLPENFAYQRYRLTYDAVDRRAELFQGGESILVLDLANVPAAPQGLERNLGAFAPSHIDGLRIWTRSRGETDSVFIDAVAVTAAPILRPGDCDLDADADLADYMTITACFSGAGVPVADRLCALCADLDGDGDVDLADFVEFQTAFTGSN